MEKVKNIIAVLIIVCLLFLVAYGSLDRPLDNKELPKEELKLTKSKAEAESQKQTDQKSALKINENAFYYTFSTIAQTLAVGFGLMLACTTYTLNRNDKVCKSYAEQMHNKIIELGFEPQSESFKLMYLESNCHNWNNFLMIIDTHFHHFKNASKNNDPESAFWYSQLKTQIEIKKHFVNSIVSGIILTTGTIVFSLVCLCFVPYFTEHPVCGQKYLFTGIFLVCLCLKSYTSTILLSLNKYPNWIGWFKAIYKGNK
ncbi:MAG: hypothetical protein KAJ07_05680 [Planctomycetes bacterium]|nr:hypothetical protein [Planctomycetota bacterium]